MKLSLLSLSLFLSFAIGATSCNNQVKENKQPTAVAPAMHEDTSKYTATMVDNKRDPSCGMPVSAGIGDTVHYKNKVLGFCSKECKDEFMKDPEKNIAAADLKK